MLQLTVKILLVLFLLIGWTFWGKSGTDSEIMTESSGLIRLHIIANSDSQLDQQLKLKVRDAVINYLAPYFSKLSSKGEARGIINEHTREIIKVAESVIAAEGLNYQASLEQGYFEFPIKAYGQLVLPAGNYEAVRIKLGKAIGQNWWCVLFPPLCFIDGTSSVRQPIEKTEQKSPNVEIKWKIAEIFSVK